MSLNVFKEYKELREKLYGLDFNSDPHGSLEYLVDFCRKRPKIDRKFSVLKTYELIKQYGKNIAERGIVAASQIGLDALGINSQVIGAENIPKEPGNIYVSNHPYGIPESLMLFTSLSANENGRNFKALASHRLKIVRGLEKHVIFLDIPAKERNNSDRKSPMRSNIEGIRETIGYLKERGDLAFFPSGDVSGYNLKEKEWHKGIWRFTRYANSIVPMWFSGPNHSNEYNFISKLYFPFRVIHLFNEAWNKKGKTIILNIDKPIYPDEIKNLGLDNGGLVSYVRKKAEALKIDSNL